MSTSKKTNTLVRISYNIGYAMASSSIAGWNGNSVRQALLDERIDLLWYEAWTNGICDKDKNWLSDEHQVSYNDGYQDAQNDAKRHE